MTREPMIDHGQTLTGPAGKVIGFLDGKEKFESFADTLLATGYPETSVTLLYGEDGIHLLERMQEHRFFFSDSEDSIIQTGIRELKLGHCAVSVEVRRPSACRGHRKTGKTSRGTRFHVLRNLGQRANSDLMNLKGSGLLFIES